MFLTKSTVLFEVHTFSPTDGGVTEPVVGEWGEIKDETWARYLCTRSAYYATNPRHALMIYTKSFREVPRN